ncbi:cytochrome P450 94A1-like [Euphorbia lathyris]|uniref:cytochrome P450 94A1-like n=1 Tax=Euphorbia lathyris TaxID=212925 RepID=UPI00331329D0
MSELNLFIFFITFLIFLLLFFSTRRPSPKTTAPSPQSYPIIGNLPGFLRNRHRFHDWVTEMLSETPSSTLQVNSFLNLSHGICTANPNNLQHLLVTNFSNYIKGSRFLNVLFELLGYGIFNVDSHLWITQRKISSYEFNTKSLRFFVSDVVNYELSDFLFPCLSNFCDDNSVFDLQNLLSRFTFTNICKLAFGVDPEFIPNLNFAKAFDDAVEICFFSRFLAPFPPLWKLKRFFNLGSEKRLKEAIQTINDFAMEIIKSKLHEEDDNQDLLSRFIHLSSTMEFEDEQHKIKFLRDIIISFVLAGKDSTSTALTWFFWLIAGNPHVAESIHRELTEAASSSSSSAAAEATSRILILSYDELKKLDYLHAALSETMRLFPPVPINSRSTVDDDVLPDGTHVGQGWFADYSAYAMGRMERVWGHDCREFKPERWLNGDGKYEPLDQFRFPVFHCGPRSCLGKDLAYVQMKAIVAAVVYEFEIVAVDGGASAERMVNPPYVVSLILKMKGGLHVRLKRRERR